MAHMSATPGRSWERRKWDPMWLAKALADPGRPVFLLGSVPPREGTSPEDAATICEKFVERSRCHATDGFIVYDIQDEASRTVEARPFPCVPRAPGLLARTLPARPRPRAHLSG